MKVISGPLREGAARLVDDLLEVSVAGSFSRIGYLARSRLSDWAEPPSLGRATLLVTGASSGIGEALARRLADLGANILVNGRNPQRIEAVCRDIEGSGGHCRPARFDVAEPEEVDSFAESLAASGERLDGIVHNAGALFDSYRTNSQGVELTLATHLLGPFRLTWKLAPLLVATGRSVITTMSSGGMYTQPLDLDLLESHPDNYRGAVAYARAKRAQVVLSHEWARRFGPKGVRSHAVHPGWVSTPGLDSGLPSFRLLGPLLRSPEEGADTAAWVAANSLAGPETFPKEGFWHDRRQRGEHYLLTTRPQGSAAGRQGEMLWDWCTRRACLSAGAASEA